VDRLPNRVLRVVFPSAPAECMRQKTQRAGAPRLQQTISRRTCKILVEDRN
jgi:hypothetical protein